MRIWVTGRIRSVYRSGRPTSFACETREQAEALIAGTHSSEVVEVEVNEVPPGT